MKLDKKQVKTAGIATSMAVAGFVGGHVANKFTPAKVSKYGHYISGALGLGIAVVSKNEAAQAFGVGMATHAVIKTVNNFTGPSFDDAGNAVEATGFKAMIAQHTPQLSGGSFGYAGMGNLSFADYNESDAPLLMGVGQVGEPAEMASEEWM